MDKANCSLRTSNIGLTKLKTNTLVLGFFKENLNLGKELSEIDRQCGNAISTFISSFFKGEKCEIRNIYLNKDIKNLFLIDLGEKEKYDTRIALNALSDASRRLRDMGIESYSLQLSSFQHEKINNSDLVEKISIAALVGLYRFTELKTKDKDKLKFIKEIIILTDKNYEKEINFGALIAEAITKTRDLITTPPNIATPEYMANYAKQIAKDAKIKCTVYDENDIRKMKMNCFLAVSGGSILKPRLAVMEYNGAKEKPIILVGKGITFDSGGLNLKPYPNILNMKDDKGGAVALIHIMEVVAKLKLPVNLIVITPFCENMPSGSSYRPDDVITAYNGMTVEVRNTDAEGRMILCDALAYAADKDPQAIIDIATLTGAAAIVLGSIGTPFLSNNDRLTDSIKKASEKSLEKLWELPLWPEYEEQLKSDVADVKHIGEEGEAGVITATMFLKHFVKEVPWAHIDIGSSVWSKSEKGFLTKGPTGSTVRLMVELLRDWKKL